MAPLFTLSHLAAAVLFALFSSVIFAITLQEELTAQLRYGLKAFAWFLGGTILGGWLLFLLNPH